MSGATTNSAETGTQNLRHDVGVVSLALGALGIVYGDLGTSPLYSIREAFENSHHRLEVDRVNVLGAMSIIVWTLVLIIAIKYVLLVMRADNRGEGGILALTALVTTDRHSRSPTGDERRTRRSNPPMVMLGLFGTALLFGDGMITPAISVVSAVEGAKLVNPDLDSAVVPVSLAILVGLFSIQRFGTAKVGKVFGPIMLLWFGMMAVFGAVSLARSPEVLQAINPWHAVTYFRVNTTKAFLSMGSLFLVVTGGEALYADMGHFGRRPITVGWFGVAMPSLLLTYLGIGGLLLRDPEAIESPFFLLAPDSIRLPVVILATFATVIASQALISGVSSITYQAIQLGYAPRSKVVYTSSMTRGQIYIPIINWALMIACLALVVAFRTSAAMAAAFGLSVTGTMFITTILFAFYARRSWEWPALLVWPLAGFILAIEGAFLVANIFKIPEGGWFPLIVAIVVFTLLTTWKTGRSLVNARLRANSTTLQQFTAGLQRQDSDVRRVEGTAVYLCSQAGVVPPSLLTNVRAGGSLHDEVYIVTVAISEQAFVHQARRVSTGDCGAGVVQVVLHYGFMESNQVADDLRVHLYIDPLSTYYFLGRETVHSSVQVGMARWREALFGLMNRNATDVGNFFHLPPDRVVEIGSRVDI